MFSDASGTIAWTATVERLSQLEAANEALMAADAYHEGSMKGAGFMPGGVDDAVSQILNEPPDPSVDRPYASTVVAVLAGGQAARGLELGLEIAAMAEQITGARTMFGTGTTGTYGGVGWITTHESLDQLQDAQEALGASTDWLAMLDGKVDGAYAEEPAFTQQRIFRRIA
jgi:glycerate-2-kinase